MIQIRVAIPRCKIVTPIDERVEDELNLQLSHTHINRFVETSFPLRLYNREARTFPKGCLPRVEHILKHLNVNYTLQSIVPKPKPQQESNFKHFPKLYDFQLRAIEKLQYNDWGIIQAPPRSGKTLIVLYDWVSLGCPQAVFIVDTIVLAEQTQRVVQKYVPYAVCGLIGDGRHSIGDVTVITSQSAFSALKGVGVEKSLMKESYDEGVERECDKHYETFELLQNASYLFRDEAHHVVCRRDDAILRRMKSTYYRRMASGTPWHRESGGLLIEKHSGPVVFSVDYEELYTGGFLIRPDILMVHMPRVKCNSKTWAGIYRFGVVENELRNQCIKIFAETLWKYGLTTAIIIRQIKHGEILRDLIPEAGVLYGGESREERAYLLNSLHHKEMMALISTVIGEGVDIASLSGMANASGMKEEKFVLQIQRQMTPAEGKQQCFVLDFVDNCRQLRSHSNKRIALYEKAGFRVHHIRPENIEEYMKELIEEV